MSPQLLSNGISVVVPAFNAAATIAAALDSALVPSSVPIEVVVVDDASSDETSDVVERIARRDPRVRLLRLSENRGPSYARNRGADLARYDWIGLLDADDRWTPGRLERLAGVVESTGAEVVSDDIEVVDLRGLRWSLNALHGWRPRPNDPFDLLHYARHGWVVQPVFTKRLFMEGGFDEQVAYGEDALLFMKWLLQGVGWFVHPAVGYEYVRRRGSLTGGGGEPRQLVGVIEHSQRDAEVVGRADVARALQPRLRRALADAALLDCVQALYAGQGRATVRAAVALAPHLLELGRRARAGAAWRARSLFSKKP